MVRGGKRNLGHGEGNPNQRLATMKKRVGAGCDSVYGVERRKRRTKTPKISRGSKSMAGGNKRRANLTIGSTCVQGHAPQKKRRSYLIYVKDTWTHGWRKKRRAHLVRERQKMKNIRTRTEKEKGPQRTGNAPPFGGERSEGGTLRLQGGKQHGTSTAFAPSYQRSKGKKGVDKGEADCKTA